MNFQDWFEGSKVVKKDGSPRLVYHGTESGDFESFRAPAFFSASKEEAEAYAMYTDTYGDTRIRYEPVGDRELPEPDAFNIFPIMSDYDGPPNKIALTEETGEEEDIGDSRYFYWDGTENALGDMNFVVLSGVRVVSSGFGPTFKMEIVYGPTKDTLAREPREIPRRIYTCYLSLKNPLLLPWQESNLLGKRLGAEPDSVRDKISKWESEGYDGIVTVSDSGIVFHNVVVTNWIAFRPEQVKIMDVENLDDYMKESLSSKVLGMLGEDRRFVLSPLAKEALKYDSFEEFENAFVQQIKRGEYWHITEDPNFVIDPGKGPRDMSSMASGGISRGALMVTSHLEHWADNYRDTRKYAALIDLTDLSPKEYRQVSRGFGNEFFLAPEAARKAKVIEVLPIKNALSRSHRFFKALPGSSDQLEEFWNMAREGRANEWRKKVSEGMVEYIDEFGDADQYGHHIDFPGIWVEPSGEIHVLKKGDIHADFAIEQDISEDDMINSGWVAARKWAEGPFSGNWTVRYADFNRVKRNIERLSDWMLKNYPSEKDTYVEFMDPSGYRGNIPTMAWWRISTGYLDEIEEALAKHVLGIVSDILSEEKGIEEKEACEKDAIEVIRVLQNAGYQAVLAGGCVRDKAMGLDPHDYDVATSAPVEEVKKLFPKTIHVGEVFGVTRVVMSSGVVEVATFRKDIGSEKGRRPQSVEFSDMEGDASRRDFTINAMFHDPISDQVHDYVGGMADLENRTLKFVGNPDERILEDHLRMLRLVRFAAKLGFTPDESSVEAVKKNVELAKKISAERIREEMTKMLMGPNPDKAIKLMQDTGLLEQVLPEVSELVGVDQPVKFHPEGDAFVHTLLVVSSLHNPSEELAWAALLHDIGKKSTSVYDQKKDRITFNGHDKAGAELADSVLRRLKFPGKTVNNIVWLIENHMKAHKFFELGDVKMSVLLRNPMFDALLDLAVADGKASAGHEDESQKIRDFVKNAPKRFRETEPLINGNDLKDMGIKPGPVFKKILDKVVEKQIEGSIETREEALSFASHMAKSLGGNESIPLARRILGVIGINESSFPSSTKISSQVPSWEVSTYNEMGPDESADGFAFMVTPHGEVYVGNSHGEVMLSESEKFNLDYKMEDRLMSLFGEAEYFDLVEKALDSVVKKGSLRIGFDPKKSWFVISPRITNRVKNTIYEFFKMCQKSGMLFEGSEEVSLFPLGIGSREEVTVEKILRFDFGV